MEIGPLACCETIIQTAHARPVTAPEPEQAPELSGAS
jgi:hypothetical protein